MKIKIGYAFVVGDLFHYGHLKFLQKCKEHCDFLIVGVYTDELAMSYKRKTIIPFKQRMALIASLEIVDMVVRVENKDCTFMLKKLRAVGYDVKYLFHGTDWKKVEGEEYIKSIGGKLIQPSYTKGISTTIIINRIRGRKDGDT